MKTKLLKKLRKKADYDLSHQSEENHWAFGWSIQADYWYPNTNLKLHQYASSRFYKDDDCEKINKKIEDLKRQYILLLVSKKRKNKPAKTDTK